MANISVSIPLTQKSFYDTTSAKANADRINNIIKPKYGKIIDNISKITNVPSELIYSFVFIESRGSETAETPYAVGLLQLSPATASDVLIKEKGLGRLEKEESEMLKKYLGGRYELIANVKPNQKTIGKTFITREDLLKPELNLLIGSILLSQMINEFTEDGKVRLDKIAVIYNTGRFSKVGKEAIAHSGTTDELITKIPQGQADYITKLVGKHSLMEGIV